MIQDAQEAKVEPAVSAHPDHLPAGYWTTVAVVAIAIGAFPFLAAYYAYGSYLRYTWPLVLPIAIVFGVMSVRALRLMIALVQGFAKGGFAAPKFLSATNLWVALAMCLGFLAGWGAGVLTREAHCRGVCTKCNSIIVALDQYEAQHGLYPTSLDSIPDMAALIEATGLVIDQGNVFENGMDVSKVDDKDALFYLTADAYMCVVPIERRCLVSITRFYVYT